jgi:hypothetical protein
MAKKRGRFFVSGLLVLAVSAALQADPYTLGDGWQLGDAPYYLGGYFSTDYWHDPYGNSGFSLYDAAVMLYGSEGPWSVMTELEMSDAYVRRFGEDARSETDLTLHAERVYAHYESSEYWNATVGKFNTPVGYWNRMPINVLRDTTSSPKVVSRIFPRFTTGAGLCTSAGALNVNMLVQVTPDLDAAFNGNNLYNNFDIDKQAGLGAEREYGNWSFGINAGGYEERREAQTWGYLYASTEYLSETFHLLAETGYRRNKKNSRSTFGAYAQGTQAIALRHFAVLRLEYISDYVPGGDDSIAVVGYTYRPVFPIALKGEYQFHSRSAENMLLLSFSMMF